MKLNIRRLAQVEYDESAEFYENREVGLGQRFSLAVRKVFHEIQQQPNRFAEIEDNIREADVPGFPFAIYYQYTSKIVNIVSVFHTSRNPDEWRRRII